MQASVSAFNQSVGNNPLTRQLTYSCLKVLQEKDQTENFLTSADSGRISDHAAQSQAANLRNMKEKGRLEPQLFEKLMNDEHLKLSVSNKTVDQKTFGNPQKPDQQV